MKEIYLLNIILLLTLFIGIVSLYDKDLISGEIESIKYGNKIITINLNNNDIPIVIFTEELTNIKNHDQIKIFGKYQTYRQKKEFIAKKIIKLS